MIVPITATIPACFGVACERHAECARYAAVEQAEAAHVIGTCDDRGTGERPLFVALEREGVPC